MTVTTTTTTDEDLDDLVEGLKAFVIKEVEPLEAANPELFEDARLLWDERGGYSKDVQALMRQVRQRSAAAGYYAMFAPEEVGGGGLGPVALYRAWEGISRFAGPGRLLADQVIGHWTSGPSFLLGELQPSVREAVLDDIMSGTSTVCFAMSEPDAGSDAWAMSTKAVKDGEEWVINGTKQWISNSSYAGYAFLWAVTDDEQRRSRSGGISCFLVPTSTPGFRVDSVLKLFEHAGGNEGIVSFTDCRIPEANLVGTLHRGFDLALRGVSNGRIYNAGHCVGMARWSLELATEYALERKTFGKPLSDYQGVTFQLAECAMEIYASHTMSLDCAERFERGEKALKQLDMMKAYTTEACFRIIDRCMQVCGGMGLTNEMRLVAGWHFARMVRIADGTGEIMRRNIANRLLKGDYGF